MKFRLLSFLIIIFALSACDALQETSSSGDSARVVRVIDGDTIDVDINGGTFRVRYIGVNTPERDEACYQTATDANAELVRGKTVRLERDVSNVDRFDRLLRYVYVGDTFVNESLVGDGYAEAVVYLPDDKYANRFQDLERAARQANLGCHPTGIFN